VPTNPNVNKPITQKEVRIMAIIFKPLGDRAVIEPLEQEEMTPAGIVIPDTAKEKPQKGKILSIGPGARDEEGKRLPMDIKVGETVLYAKYAGTEIKVDGKKLLIIKEADILAIIEG
jgi:chaperonin GroES